MFLSKERKGGMIESTNKKLKLRICVLLVRIFDCSTCEPICGVSVVMKYNPDMIVEIGSHTDCRASKRYNEKLSARRAKSAREYVI